jgi:hypothetical protein
MAVINRKRDEETERIKAELNKKMVAYLKKNSKKKVPKKVKVRRSSMTSR